MIAWKDSYPRNDLLCVERDVKLSYSLIGNVCVCQAALAVKELSSSSDKGEGRSEVVIYSAYVTMLLWMKWCFLELKWHVIRS